MIESRELLAFGRQARARLCDHVYQTQAFDSTEMLAWDTLQGALKVRKSIARQFAAVLVFDLNSHCLIRISWVQFVFRHCRRDETAESTEHSPAGGASHQKLSSCLVSRKWAGIPPQGPSEKRFLRNLLALSPDLGPHSFGPSPSHRGICTASDNIYYVAEGFASITVFDPKSRSGYIKLVTVISLKVFTRHSFGASVLVQ